MRKGGIIIRLIDVAMIILFGFIIISRLKMFEIELPSEAKHPLTETRKHIVKVKIIRDNTDDPDRYLIIDNGIEPNDFKTLDELESILITQNKTDRKNAVQLVVLIEPERNSIIQHTVDVLDLCTKHNILKNINYESVEL